MSDFTVKDSGARLEFESGMVRDVTEDKTDYSLAADGPMLKRWAEHLTRAATGPNAKYPKRNWMLAAGEEEYERFRESAFRHFMQWYYGETDEDHAAAVFFNINGKEYVETRLERSSAPSSVASATPLKDWEDRHEEGTQGDCPDGCECSLSTSRHR